MSAPAGIWGQELADADDPTLLGLVRGGDADAYAELWRRHLPAAYGVAHRHRGRTSAEDIVGEASLRVYDLIRAGKGPTTNFRSYFLATVKTCAVDAARAELRAVPTEDAGLEAIAPSEPAYDPSASVDHELVRAAFGRLPARDQQVLWRTAVEGVSPSSVATSMGMSANGVSVVALRARDGLRARYLDAHADRAISRAEDDECRWVLTQMGRFVRGKLPVRQRARVEEHLRGCRHAQGLAYEMAEVNRALPALMVPLIFVAGSSVATAWAGAAGAATSGGPTPEGKASPLAALLATVGGKVAALAVAATLGVGYAAGPGGLAAMLGGGSGGAGGAGAVLAGSGGGGSGVGTGGGSGQGSGAGSDSVAPGTAPGATGAAPTSIPAPTQAAPAATTAGGSSGADGQAGTTTSRSSAASTTSPRSSSSSSSRSSSSSGSSSTTSTTSTTTTTTSSTTTSTTPPPPPPPPVALGNNPSSLTAGTSGSVGATFTGSGGGTIAVALDVPGTLTLSCPSLSGTTCTFTGAQGVVGVTAVPAAYPPGGASVTVTVTNAAGGRPLVVTLPIYPPAPAAGSGVPTTAVGETPIPVTVVFGSAAGGTVSAAVSPGGTVDVACKDGTAPDRCRIPEATAVLSVSATPTAYPAVLLLTLVNADGGASTVVQIALTAPVPQLGGPSTIEPGQPLALTVDTGTAAGGVLTTQAPGWAHVALTGCTPTADGCLLAGRLATVTVTLTPGQGEGPAAAGSLGLATTPEVVAWEWGHHALRIILTNAAGMGTAHELTIVHEHHRQPNA